MEESQRQYYAAKAGSHKGKRNTTTQHETLQNQVIFATAFSQLEV
jgi:hypothetical protein